MDFQRWWLFAAGFCFLLSFGRSIYALGAGSYRPGRFNLAAIAAGFGCQSVYLYLRGQVVGACPLTTLADALVFLAWAIVLIYLIIGPAYRLSLMGVFTAPLVLLLQLAAVPFWDPAPTPRHGPPDALVELHAALSVVAYGAFGLAAVAGLMYLVQERQLKRHTVSTLFYNLPPIQDLASATTRLIGLGFLLLTVAFAAGLASKLPVDTTKLVASLILWALYGVVLLLRSRHRLRPHRLAACAVAIFVLAIVTLPAVHYLSIVP